MNNPWDYRKNLAQVGEVCPHEVWWSMDCPACIALVDQTQRHLKNYTEDDD